MIGADKMSAIIYYTDLATCIIFNDNGNAVLLEPNYEGFGVKDIILKANESGAEFLHMKVEWIPTTTVPITDEQAEDVSKLIDRLEQDEDVQKVFHNMG